MAKGKSVTVPIPKDVLELARKRGVSEKELLEFAKKNLELSFMFMFSGMTKKKALSISKTLGRAAWTKL